MNKAIASSAIAFIAPGLVGQVTGLGLQGVIATAAGADAPVDTTELDDESPSLLRSAYHAARLASLDASADARQADWGSPKASAVAMPWSGDQILGLQLQIGARTLDDDAWAPIDSHAAVGAAFFSEDPSSLGFEAGFLVAADRFSHRANSSFDPDIEGDLLVGELYGGIRKTFTDWLFFGAVGIPTPYIGAGISLNHVTYDGNALGDSGKDTDFVAAGYLHAGLLWPVGAHARIGLDGRMVLGSDASLNGASTDLDYEQLSLVFEFSF